MDLTLVPFGYQLSQDKLVDVQQVPSGKKCGCTCPSCHAPLIARHGSKKVWHFAHDSKGELNNKLEKCSFSFYVSARMMARQLIGDRLSINLPRLEVAFTETEVFSNKQHKVTRLVTEARSIILENVLLDTNIGENRVDLSGFIEGYCLGFIFTHPGRDEFNQLTNFNEVKTGIVEIDLTGLMARFHIQKDSNRSYSDILTEFITQDLLSKKWLYHPRRRDAERQAKIELEKKIATANKPFEAQRIALKKTMRFDCRACKSTWTGSSANFSSCNHCGAPPLMVARKEMPTDQTES